MKRLGFLDINWKRYSFKAHLEAARLRRPFLTVARDVERVSDLPKILEQAHALAEFAQHVVIVPKARALARRMGEIPRRFVLGYSVPTRYGGTRLPIAAFKGRRVHLLGGRPDVQRRLAEVMDVVSIDCNRFTLDAQFGDYFDGETFRPHPVGGYHRCLSDSLRNIDVLWKSYRPRRRLEVGNDGRG